MKKFLFSLVMMVTCSLSLADTYVNGYHRKDGTYVQPHYRSSPNSTKLDNYSTIGNVNPYTGQPGTVNPYPSNTFTAPLNGSNPFFGQQPSQNPYGSSQNNGLTYGR